MASLFFLSSSAVAAPCGTPKAAEEEPVFGALTLDAEKSEPNVNAGKKVDERRMVFIFDVGECTLAADEDIEATVISSELDPAVFGDANVAPRKSVLFVQVPVKPDKFEPGKHSAIVSVEGSSINTSVSKVTLQRSENRWLIPVGICVVAALLALLGVSLRARAEASGKSAPKFNRAWFLLAAVLALGAVAVVCQTTYFEPEIWESNIGPEALLFIAAVTAAAGASTLAAGKAWTKGKAPAAADAKVAKKDPEAATPRAG